MAFSFFKSFGSMAKQALTSTSPTSIVPPVPASGQQQQQQGGVTASSSRSGFGNNPSPGAESTRLVGAAVTANGNGFRPLAGASSLASAIDPHFLQNLLAAQGGGSVSKASASTTLILFFLKLYSFSFFFLWLLLLPFRLRYILQFPFIFLFWLGLSFYWSCVFDLINLTGVYWSTIQRAGQTWHYHSSFFIFL